NTPYMKFPPDRSARSKFALTNMACGVRICRNVQPWKFASDRSQRSNTQRDRSASEKHTLRNIVCWNMQSTMRLWCNVTEDVKVVFCTWQPSISRLPISVSSSIAPVHAQERTLMPAILHLSKSVLSRIEAVMAHSLNWHSRKSTESSLLDANSTRVNQARSKSKFSRRASSKVQSSICVPFSDMTFFHSAPCSAQPLNIASLILQPDKVAPSSLALRSVARASTVFLNIAPDRLLPLKSAFSSQVSVKSAPDRSMPDRSAPVRSMRERSRP